MVVAVIGSRTFTDYDALKEILGHIYISEIISGGDRGADQLAERYAKEKNIPIRIVPHTDVTTNTSYPSYAIVDLAKLVIAFWDGKSTGTCSLVKYAQKIGKPVKVHNFRVSN